MAYLTMQKHGGGLYTTVYATVATWGDLGGGRRGAGQQRFYVGRLDGDSGLVRVTKGIAGSRRVEVDLETLRKRVKAAGSVAAVETWLRGLCASGMPAAAPAAAAPDSAPSPEPVVLLPTKDVGTALVGQGHALGGLARSIGLDRCLAEAFGEPVGAPLLHLAMHQAVQGAPLYLAEAWLDDLWLPECLAGFGFSSPGLSRLMDAVGRRETDRQSFYAAWMAERRHPRALAYDTTSISTYAADLEAAAFGHNRDGEPLPQENLALVCDRADGLPLFSRLVPGSVPDVATLDATARVLRALGLEDTEFALDRGLYTATAMPANCCSRATTSPSESCSRAGSPRTSSPGTAPRSTRPGAPSATRAGACATSGRNGRWTWAGTGWRASSTIRGFSSALRRCFAVIARSFLELHHPTRSQGSLQSKGSPAVLF